MSPKPYLAPSLVSLRATVDRLWPERDKKSDGWMGDDAHAARASEHNPDSKGCVHALDIDKDGVDPESIVAAAIAHPATWYVIWNGKIRSRTYGWKVQEYHGANPHTAHVHISINLNTTSENSKVSWNIKEDELPLSDADLTKIGKVVEQEIRDYVERPATGTTRDFGDGVQSVSLRLWNAAARDAWWNRTVGIPAVLKALGEHDTVDETALAGALAPLLIGSLSSVPDATLAEIATAVNDESDKRARERLA